MAAMASRLRECGWPRKAAAVGMMCAATLAVNAPSSYALGPLTFAEEFNGSTLDLTRWTYRGVGPRDESVITPTAVSVGNGMMTITTFSILGVHYTGTVSTDPLAPGVRGFEQTHGYFEARIRSTSRPGQASAFWLQTPTMGSPPDDPAAAGVEMDIMEHRARCVSDPDPNQQRCSPGNDITDRIQRALIWDGYSTNTKAVVNLSDPLPGLSNGSWHTYGLLWTPTGVTFYYDGASTWSLAGPISQRSQFIVLSSGVAAYFAGAVPPGGYGSPQTSTVKMDVDWVHVYAL
jgi:endo-1,3-1,4-beta-glycanase ExoK